MLDLVSRKGALILASGMLAVGALGTGCSQSDGDGGKDETAPAGANAAPTGGAGQGTAAPRPQASENDATAPVSAAQLRGMLLDQTDLGNRFAQADEPASQADAIKGCAELDRLVGGPATADVLDIELRQNAEVTFKSSTSPIDLTEALGSDSPARIDAALGPLAALARCGKATFVSAQGDLDVTFAEKPASVAGGEARAYEMSFSGTRIRLTVVRIGGVLMSLSGDPDIVDALLPTAVRKVANPGGH
ncbi:MAG: hypothetical protein HOV68_09630 [Streptomycetaceae bacterium]|nr:hypothetical protein [Streptomycetaceae bacterium]